MRLFQAFAGLTSAIFLVGSLLTVNCLQIASLVLLPFSRRAFRRFNRECANAWWSLTVLMAERVLGMKVRFTGEDVPAGENAIVIANHQEMPDIIVVMTLGLRKKRLGDFKWFVKDVIKYVPGIGWGMLFLDCLFLKRDWAADRNRIMGIFRKFVEQDIPFWLVFFPEGTRIRPHKLAKSQRYAEKHGWTVPRHVMLPKTKGFVSAAQGLANRAAAVYELTIGYDSAAPTLWALMSGSIRHVHLHVRRYPMAGLPRDPAGLADWLRQRYVEKDGLLAEFKRNGCFPGPELELPLA